MFDLSQLVTVTVAFVAAELALAVVVGRWLARAADAQLATVPEGAAARRRVVVPERSSSAWN